METEKKEASILECQVQAGLHAKNKPHEAALGFCQPGSAGEPLRRAHLADAAAD